MMFTQRLIIFNTLNQRTRTISNSGNCNFYFAHLPYLAFFCILLCKSIMRSSSFILNSFKRLSIDSSQQRTNLFHILFTVSLSRSEAFAASLKLIPSKRCKITSFILDSFVCNPKKNVLCLSENLKLQVLHLRSFLRSLPY